MINPKYIDHTDHFFVDSIFNLAFVVHNGHDTAYHYFTIEKICVDSTNNSNNVEPSFRASSNGRVRIC